MMACAQFAATPRIERPEIRISRPARRETVDVQLDLEKLMAAAVIEQALFVRELRGGFLEGALHAFLLGFPERVLQAFYQRAEVRARHAERVAELLAAAGFLGRLQVRRSAGLAVESSSARANFEAAFAETLGRVSPQRAVQYLRSLPIGKRMEWDAAIAGWRNRAFSVAGVEQETILKSLRDLIVGSLSEGITPAEFEKRAGELLKNYEIGAMRLRTIWNTNVGTALARGRKEELDDPEVSAVLGYRLFDAMNDQFTRPNHLLLDGGIAPGGWDGWARNAPLLGFNCRCVLLGITRTRAERMIGEDSGFDLTLGVPDGAGPDAGFK